jgi:dethiobiotin synthetase
MSRAYFVTGTDTEVGKTFVSCALLALAKKNKRTTAGVKPIASGAVATPEGLRNEDGLALLKQCSLPLTYEDVNPVVFEQAIAPHIAAQQTGREVSVQELALSCEKILKKQADVTLIEGAGGWRVPVNEWETLADLAKNLQLPVILVVGMRLGCINHAVLTAEAIRRDGLRLAGWVANRVTPFMNMYEENFLTLNRLISAPCIGHVPYLQHGNPELATDHFTLSFE